MSSLTRADENEVSSVVALIALSVQRERLIAAYGDLLFLAASPRELIRASGRGSVELVILSHDGPWKASLTATVAAVRARTWLASIYMYTDRSVAAMHELMALARAGATAVLVQDADDDPAGLRRLLAAGGLASVLETLKDIVSRTIPAPARALALLCIEHVTGELSAEELAARFGVSRRTMSSWAAGLGVKGVRSLVSRIRVLAAIGLLGTSTHSVERVALVLQFSSSAQLYNMIRRYTGRLPKEAASAGLTHWCRALLCDPANALHQRRQLPDSGDVKQEPHDMHQD